LNEIFNISSVAVSTSSVPVSSITIVASSQISVSPSTTQAAHTGTRQKYVQIPILQNMAAIDDNLPMIRVVLEHPTTSGSINTATTYSSAYQITRAELASPISVTQSDIISSPGLAAQPSAGSSPVLVTQSLVTSPPAPATSTPGAPLFMSTDQAASEEICDTAAGINCKLEPTGQVENPTDRNDEEDHQLPSESEKPTDTVAVVEGATGGPPQGLDSISHYTDKHTVWNSHAKLLNNILIHSQNCHLSLI